jgi:hypothetical protein
VLCRSALESGALAAPLHLIDESPAVLLRIIDKAPASMSLLMLWCLMNCAYGVDVFHSLGAPDALVFNELFVIRFLGAKMSGLRSSTP